MKKALIIVIAVVIVAAAVFVGTRFMGLRGPKVENPFTFDYETTPEVIKARIDGDDMATLLASSPYYAGQPLPGQHTQEFDEARAKKCDEIMADSDKLAEDALKLKPKVDELRKALLDYLTVCINNEPKSETFVKDAGGEVIRVWTMENAIEAEYKSIDTKSKNKFARTYMQYVKTAKAVELASLYLQDIDNIVAFAAMGLEGLSKTKNAKIWAANKQLDSSMAKFDDMKGDIEEVMAGARKVGYGFKQLATGDYYFARMAVKFMRDSMPKLKEDAAKIKPSKYLDADGVAFTKDYLAKFDRFSAGFKEYLDSVPQSELIPVTLTPDAPGCAFAADEQNDYGKAYVSVSEPAKDPGEEKPGWLATGWNGVKKVVHGTQSVIGVGIDIAGTTVKNLSRIPTGIYYGNSAKEIWGDMKKNTREIGKNWDNNKSGSDTMRTANGYLNGVDEGAEWIASTGIEKTPLGKGWISWGTGKVAKAASSIFTGLGKGITLVSNRDASGSDYVIGVIEIGSAALGGSKLVIKGSQVPAFLKGLGKGSWISAKRAFNSVSGLFAKMEKAEIDAGIRTALKYGMETAGFNGRKLIAEGLLTAIAQSNAALKAELSNIIKQGVKAGWTNFNGTLRESLFNFARKNMAGNLKTLSESLVAGLGKNATEFVDNLIGQWAEDALKEMVDQAMAEAPLAEELKGEWTGTTTFTSINIPEAAARKASNEGCDIAGAIRKLKDKPLPTTMRMDGSPSGSGSMVLTINAQGKGSPINARYTYKAGVLAVSQGIKGGSVTLHGNARRMTQGYSISGSAGASIGGGEGGSIRMSGNFKVTKPH